MQLPLVLALAGAALALILCCVLWSRLTWVTKRLDQALAGASGDLEETLVRQHGRVEEVDTKLSELLAEYERLSAAQALSSQKISLVRFNPFGDTGGDQSFSLAVLDAHDSGYVLTSIHGRQGTRVYVKPVDYGDSKYPLSEEEQQALGQARKRTAEVK